MDLFNGLGRGPYPDPDRQIGLMLQLRQRPIGDQPPLAVLASSSLSPCEDSNTEQPRRLTSAINS